MFSNILFSLVGNIFYATWKLLKYYDHERIKRNQYVNT